MKERGIRKLSYENLEEICTGWGSGVRKGDAVIFFVGEV